MIGIYDSGSGGLTALCALREQAGEVDILYRGDLLHAPYGIRSREELLPILGENIAYLRSLGCEHILVACMTASALIPLLPKEEQRHIYPITDYVGARALAVSRTKRIGIVSTSRTMLEGRLREYLQARCATVSESAADRLVPLAERAQTSPRDSTVTEVIAEAVAVHREAGVDTLVLGCTHFPFFTEAFREAMGERVALVSSSQAGALGFLKQIPKDVLKGQGHIHFI